MSAEVFDYSGLLADNLPAPAVKWAGFPTHNFVGGHNAPESIPVADLIEASTRVLEREGPTLAMYRVLSGPQGYLPLREFLAAKLKRQADIECTTDEILLTTGSSQAIELVLNVLVSRGDTIVVERATYGGVLTRFARHAVNMVTVPVDHDGMDVDALGDELARLKSEGVTPKFVYTIPTIQNPTGSILPLERRQRMLELAYQYGVPIFEDECYSDLIWSGARPPAIYSLDTNGQVIFCGTFSKSIAPALRVGYLVAPWPLLARAIACKTDAGSGSLEQMVLGEYCTKHFDVHVAGLNRLLEAKLDILIESLNENFGTTVEFTRPPGGIFLWVRLPDAVDTSELAAVAGARSIAINPGAEWSKDLCDGNRYMRLCFASASNDQIRSGVEALAEVCHDRFGVPTRSANRER